MGDKFKSSIAQKYGLTPDAERFLNSTKRMFINGNYVDSQSGQYDEIENPCTKEVIARAPQATNDEVDIAVRAAHDAMTTGEWSKYTPRQREHCLRHLATLIRENLQTIAEIESLDSGKAISGCKAVDVPVAANTFEYFAGWATKIQGASRDTSFLPNAHTFTRKEPVGVVGAIVPWNWPLAMAAWKLAAPLSVGCSVVLKPAELTPLSMLYLMELVQKAGFPEGAINIITGPGPSTGEALVNHPLVEKVSFTGSTVVGQHVGSIATSRCAHSTLELGGKSPMLAFEDADISALANNTLGSIYFNAGQVCSAGSRLYVHDSRYDEAIERIKAIAEGIKLGPSLDPETQMGPLISQKQLNRVTDYIALGSKEGAELITGGNAVDSEGYFVEPTLFANCDNSMTIVQEEIFGPVLTVIPFSSDEEAVTLANDNKYGLASSIWTKDISRAHRLIPQIKAGNVWVNIHDPGDPSMPFGGYKDSGIGKDLGPEQLEHFLQTKSVWINC